MIPTLIVAGLVVGSFTRDRISRLRVVTVAAILSLVWGIAVGVSNGSLSTFVGASGLGFANLLAGTLVAQLARWANPLRALRRDSIAR